MGPAVYRRVPLWGATRAALPLPVFVPWGLLTVPGIRYLRLALTWHSGSAPQHLAGPALSVGPSDAEGAAPHKHGGRHRPGKHPVKAGLPLTKMAAAHDLILPSPTWQPCSVREPSL